MSQMMREGRSSERWGRVRVVTVVVAVCASLFFSGFASGDPAALTRFVAALPRQPRAVVFAAGTPSAYGIREKLALDVEIKEGGYPAAVYVSAAGDVTFLASPRRAAPGVAGLWELFGLDQQRTTGPEGYDLLVVLLDAAAPWTGAAALECLEFKPGAAEIPALLERVGAQLAGGTASAVMRVLEIGLGEGGGTRELRKKEKPTIPVWLAGVRG